MGRLRFLLDTHALLWWLFDDPRLSAAAREIVAEPANEILVSAATAWEVATKHRLGKLAVATELVKDIDGWVDRAGFTALPVSIVHAQERSLAAPPPRPLRPHARGAEHDRGAAADHPGRGVRELRHPRRLVTRVRRSVLRRFISPRTMRACLRASRPCRRRRPRRQRVRLSARDRAGCRWCCTRCGRCGRRRRTRAATSPSWCARTRCGATTRSTPRDCSSARWSSSAR